jgi:DnaJ-class molecular chaperone
MKKPCESCGGSGQVSYFKGVSRFLLSTEECPECSGLGYIIPIAEDGDSLAADNDDQGSQPDKKQKL